MEEEDVADLGLPLVKKNPIIGKEIRGKEGVIKGA